MVLSAVGTDDETDARENLASGLKAFDAHLLRTAGTTGGFFLGEDLSMAEVLTAPFILRRMATLPAIAGLDLREHCQKEGLSRLLQWMDAVAARPSLVDTTPPQEDLVESVRRMLKRIAESK
mmetsp:Transcript_17488/g.38102  ORF Transcript_17488/g.38102 Transcript_17488/m.38102 type:complete len:122 (-) Transcript_17488:364-729(-)